MRDEGEGGNEGMGFSWNERRRRWREKNSRGDMRVTVLFRGDQGKNKSQGVLSGEFRRRKKWMCLGESV